MVFTKLHKYKDLGLLIARFGVGFGFIFVHGWPKLNGGPQLWEKIGGAVSNIGITFAPQFWGLMAGLAEFVGGILLVLGFMFVPAGIFISFTLLMAIMNHFHNQDPWSKVIYPIELLSVMLGFIFIGPGRYSLDAWFKRDDIKLQKMN